MLIYDVVYLYLLSRHYLLHHPWLSLVHTIQKKRRYCHMIYYSHLFIFFFCVCRSKILVPHLPIAWISLHIHSIIVIQHHNHNYQQPVSGRNPSNPSNPSNRKLTESLCISPQYVHVQCESHTET